MHRGNALVHVSGHASAGELLYAYNIVQPRNVMPVHGEIRHLRGQRRPRRRDRRAGRPGRASPRTAWSIDLVDGVARVVGKVDCGYVFVDGSTVGDITESELKDRRILGEEGFISIIAVIDSDTGKSSAGPRSTPAASPRTTRSSTTLRPRLIDALEQAIADGVDDAHQLQQVIRRGSAAG